MWIDNTISKPLKEGNYKTLVEIDEHGNLKEMENDYFNGKEWDVYNSHSQFISYWWCEKEVTNKL